MASTKRRIALPYPKERGPNGRKLCRWCLQEVPKGRLLWCGEKCVDEYKIRNNPGFARKKVFERDKGICAGCGKDSARIGRVMRALRRRALEWNGAVKSWDRCLFFFRLTKGRSAQYRAWAKFRDHDWEADHIVPVIEGGADLGLQNLRTLCLGCHQRQTAALARRRSQARKRAPEALL